MENKTILVIEDDRLNKKLVKTLLKSAKSIVIEAIDAESGISLAQKHKPDLILMDIQLPGMDGFEATRVIKKDPALRDIPIVALTSCSMDEDKEEAMQAGCIGYLTKPIDTRNFVQIVGQYVR